MIKSIKTWILIGFASILLVACGQGGGSGSKKSKTLQSSNGILGFYLRDSSFLQC